MTRVYLHGAGLNGASWGGVPGRALDLPGHGGTARTRPATASGFAKAIAPEIEDGSVVIGHSMGGMVAMTLAAEHPEKVSALILVSVPIRAPLRFISWYTPFVAPIVTRVPGTKTIAKVVGSRVENEVAREKFRATVGSANPSGLADALCVAGAFNGFDVLPKVSAPVLAITGVRSLMTVGDYENNLMRLCPHAKIVTLDAGHQIPFDAPAEMEAEIGRFLDSLA